MEQSSPTLQQVEASIENRQRGFRLPGALENQFELDTRGRRAQRLRFMIPAMAIIYNLFLIPDWFLIRDEIGLTLCLHFLVVTPWILLVGWFVKDDSSQFVREAAAASIPAAVALQILTTFTLTASAHADHYQYFVLLVLLYMNTIQRLRFHYAACVSGIVVILHAIAVTTAGHMTPSLAAVAIITLCVAAFITLVSNYYAERDARRSYLYNLRDRLRHADAENTSRRDALTDLANRHYLSARLAQLWDDSNQSSVAIVMLDIDHFKPFNDRYGHVVGDACIKRVAGCVLAELRNENDLAVRYGGEELLVLLPSLSLPDAMRVAERIRRSVEALAIPHQALGQRGVVTVSCGAASGPVSALSAQELIASADTALYAAKRNGRNQVWPPLVRASLEEQAAPKVSYLKRT